MKIAKYKGLFYLYISSRTTCNVVTTHSEKALDGFVYEDGTYFKNVQEGELSEIFEIHYRIKYDTGISGVPSEWEVGNGSQDIKGENIMIRYSNGILPGWNMEEKNVCIKYVDKKEIPFGEIIKVYQKKDEVMLNSPERVVERVDVDAFISVQLEYRRNNL